MSLMLSVVTYDCHTVNVKIKPLKNIWFDTDAALYYILLYMLYIAYYYFRWLLLFSDDVYSGRNG